MIANPGSAAALKEGCRCPVMDNYHGNGLYEDEHGKTVFIIMGNCPLHAKEDWDK